MFQLVNSKISLSMKTIDLVVLSLMRDLILCHESKKAEYSTHPYYTWALLLYQQSKIFVSLTLLLECWMYYRR